MKQYFNKKVVLIKQNISLKCVCLFMARSHLGWRLQVDWGEEEMGGGGGGRRDGRPSNMGGNRIWGEPAVRVDWGKFKVSVEVKSRRYDELQDQWNGTCLKILNVVSSLRTPQAHNVPWVVLCAVIIYKSCCWLLLMMISDDGKPLYAIFCGSSCITFMILFATNFSAGTTSCGAIDTKQHIIRHFSESCSSIGNVSRFNWNFPVFFWVMI